MPIAGPPRSGRYWTAVVVVVVVVVGGGVLLLVVVLVLVLALVLGLVVLRSILVSSIVVFFASRMSLERKGESQRKLQKQTKGTKTVKILKLCWKKKNTTKRNYEQNKSNMGKTSQTRNQLKKHDLPTSGLQRMSFLIDALELDGEMHNHMPTLDGVFVGCLYNVYINIYTSTHS